MRPISQILGSCQAVGHILPVDHLPDVLQVLGPQVVVLLVVCMLPHVDAQHWRQPLHHRPIVLRAAAVADLLAGQVPRYPQRYISRGPR